jgi:hypothetical protein
MRGPGSTLAAIVGYGALWISIVVLCGIVGASTATIGIPASWDRSGMGIGMMLGGTLGLIGGTLAATLTVMFVREKRRRRHQSS